MTYPLFNQAELSQQREFETINFNVANRTRLEEIGRLDDALTLSFTESMAVNEALSRQLVSFQTSKARAISRWFKFKEAFSDALVEYLFASGNVVDGPVLDPFAGSGTTLFASAMLGFNSEGIELLPIGQEIIAARQLLQGEYTVECLKAIQRWRDTRPWETTEPDKTLHEVKITRGAYPPATKRAIELYVSALKQEPLPCQKVLRFALLCILESVSFTRKDGQYLRWDARAGRKVGKIPFNKGPISDFRAAIISKFDEILSDTQQYPLLTQQVQPPGLIHVHPGSCLEIMPSLSPNQYSAVMTSPPYCNRYDYTRTYALELALLGATETRFIELRQNMLSCTVENKAKNLVAINPGWQRAIDVVDNTELLQRVIAYLEEEKQNGSLNNDGIPRMVKGYFYEMACVISECARVLRPGAPMFMVNDNVRYQGASISVDLILSHFANHLGFDITKIYILPQGKGNSSQQMGAHGRNQLRKSVYFWRKRDGINTATP